MTPAHCNSSKYPAMMSISFIIFLYSVELVFHCVYEEFENAFVRSKDVSLVLKLSPFWFGSLQCQENVGIPPAFHNSSAIAIAACVYNCCQSLVEFLPVLCIKSNPTSAGVLPVFELIYETSV